mmetsp:Transcript_70825/g.140379  ORF Transcript_70825/g.140379 Transcript_70825/m.140379 type:complete len:93 (-) Transcript_70825:1926-2204(-)
MVPRDAKLTLLMPDAPLLLHSPLGLQAARFLSSACCRHAAHHEGMRTASCKRCPPCHRPLTTQFTARPSMAIGTLPLYPPRSNMAISTPPSS